MSETVKILKQILNKTISDIQRYEERIKEYNHEIDSAEYELHTCLCRRDELIESIQILEDKYGSQDVITSED